MACYEPPRGGHEVFLKLTSRLASPTPEGRVRGCTAKDDASRSRRSTRLAKNGAIRVRLQSRQARKDAARRARMSANAGFATEDCCGSEQAGGRSLKSDETAGGVARIPVLFEEMKADDPPCCVSARRASGSCSANPGEQLVLHERQTRRATRLATKGKLDLRRVHREGPAHTRDLLVGRGETQRHHEGRQQERSTSDKPCLISGERKNSADSNPRNPAHRSPAGGVALDLPRHERMAAVAETEAGSVETPPDYGTSGAVALRARASKKRAVELFKLETQA